MRNTLIRVLSVGTIICAIRKILGYLYYCFIWRQSCPNVDRLYIDSIFVLTRFHWAYVTRSCSIGPLCNLRCNQSTYLLPNTNTWPTFIDFRTFYSMIRTIVTLVIITVIPNNWLGREWTVKASDLNMCSADCHQVPDVLTMFIAYQCVSRNYNFC